MEVQELITVAALVALIFTAFIVCAAGGYYVGKPTIGMRRVHIEMDEEGIEVTDCPEDTVVTIVDHVTDITETFMGQEHVATEEGGTENTEEEDEEEGKEG